MKKIIIPLVAVMAIAVALLASPILAEDPAVINSGCCPVANTTLVDNPVAGCPMLGGGAVIPGAGCPMLIDGAALPPCHTVAADATSTATTDETVTPPVAGGCCGISGTVPGATAPHCPVVTGTVDGTATPPATVFGGYGPRGGCGMMS